MKVTITFETLPSVTMSIKEWELIGRQKGYCKANKIFEYQITGIEYHLTK
jgi:hypothetical protein